MSPTKPASPADLVGQDAYFASLPMADTPAGGMESSFRGETAGMLAGPVQPAPPQQSHGPLMDEPGRTVFKTLDELVRRYELIAQSHLAQDTHWTYVKLGYPWSTLTKDPKRSSYTQSLPYGSAGITVQAVPNKSWDLINKTTEALLQDFPQGEAEPASDSEDAQAACEMANRFLAEDGSEHGTNDAALFHDRVEKSLTCASSYLECWVDPTGGGYVPLQIKAHPQATDPSNPLVDPQGNPTADYVLRYVTAEGPNGEPPQFTTDPADAAPQWQPKLRAAKWEREHIRVFPESATIDQAEKVIILGYCTIGEGKRRWPTVAEMSPEQLSALCDWTPVRYLVLLPPFQRARWTLSDGREKEKAGSSDERIFFYYHVYAKASPDHTKGADVVVSGATGGTILNRQLLAKPVQIATSTGTVSEIRCMEIPLVQVMPRNDPDEKDPTGRAFIELFAGAAEHNAHLAMSFAEVLDQILHTPFAVPATSPIEGWQVAEARASGDMLLMTGPNDKPTQLNPPLLPTSFYNMYELADEAINSIASSERAASGADNSKERSGKALQIAVSRNNVALSGMNTAVNNAVARWMRIKIEQAMAHFSTAQMIRYVGEDGAYKQDEWSGTDFALVGKVTIKAGTGTMLDDDAKVQYLGNLKASQLLTPEEATDAARPSYARRLGLAPDPQQQRIERQVTAWLKGPPTPQQTAQSPQPVPWVQQAQQYAQAKATADQQNQAAQAQWSAMAQKHQGDAANAASAQLPHTTMLPPQPQPEPPIDPATGQPMSPPWSPFAPALPMDTEPVNAMKRMRRLGNLMAKVEFSEQLPEWQQLVIGEYQAMASVISAAQPPAPMPHGVNVAVKADAQTVAQAEHAATHPAPAQPQPQPQAA